MMEGILIPWALVILGAIVIAIFIGNCVDDDKE